MNAILYALAFYTLGMGTSLAILLSASGNWGAVIWPW